MNWFVVLLPLHVAAVVVWVGGMFFAHQCLRPTAIELLEPPLRLRLWRGVFVRFFRWVWGSVLLIPASGLVMLASVGFGNAPRSWHLMLGLGSLMVGIFVFVFFVPYRRLCAAVANEDWAAGGMALALIRHLVGVNLLLGLATIVVATAGRYWS